MPTHLVRRPTAAVAGFTLVLALAVAPGSAAAKPADPGPASPGTEASSGSVAAAPATPLGLVYTSTNSPAGNEVLAYRRSPGGVLTLVGRFPTGGRGTGDRPAQLGPPDTDQSLIVSPDRRLLLTVNQRSDSIAVFRILRTGLLRPVYGSPFPSLGNMPTSLGLAGDRLYVVNKDDDPVEGATPGTVPNYRGFWMSDNGFLSPIPGSRVTAPEGSSPTQALISKDGRHLFSSDFFAHQLRSLSIAGNGRLSEAPGSPLATRDYPRPPADQFPAGNIVVGLQEHPTRPVLYVGQAANGLVGGARQVAVYTYDRAGRLRFVRAVRETGVAACWFIISRDGRRMYVVNTFDSSVSVMDLSNPLNPVETSKLTLSDGPTGGPGTGTSPNQFALTPDERYLYVSSGGDFSGNPAHNALYVLRVNPDDTLTEVAKTRTGAYPPLGAAVIPDPGRGDDQEGAVFVGTNHNNTTDPSEPANRVAMYRRAVDGRLTLVGYFRTGGQGSGPGQRFAGDGLGAGNSVQLTRDRRFLLVTNAGSDTVSVFRVRHDRLVLTDVEPTGDSSQGHRFPNSVAQFGDLVYVLNSADRGSITGFQLSPDGRLTPLPRSTRTINGNQHRYPPDALFNPTQIDFTPDGSKLVVSIKDGPRAGLVPGVTPTGPGRVLIWNVTRQGTPSASFVRTDFNNRGPFGFSFDRSGNLLVALFVGGGIENVNGTPQLTGAAGSYRINRNGTLTAITRAAKDHQLDTCWLVNNGRYAYGSNYASGTISSFRVGAGGSLTLLNKAAGVTDNPGNIQGATPLDLGISPEGKSLYLVEPGSGKVGAWAINNDGSLTKLNEYPGLPRAVNGDHARIDFGAGGSPAGIDVW
jgi:6-phosphogluconolactonase